MIAKRARPAQLALVPPLPDGLRNGLRVTGSYSPDLWVSDHPRDCEQAVAICRRCPVLAQCRSWATSMRPADDLLGIFGAMTVGERNAVRSRRQHSLDAAAAP